MRKVTIIAALLLASCGKNQDVKLHVQSVDSPSLTQTLTLTQDGKSQTFTEGIDEDIILHKGKVQYTLTTTTTQTTSAQAYVEMFVNGALVKDIVCDPNSSTSGEFKLKP